MAAWGFESSGSIETLVIFLQEFGGEGLFDFVVFLIKSSLLEAAMSAAGGGVLTTTYPFEQRLDDIAYV